jgi:hypothetical protein
MCKVKHELVPDGQSKPALLRLDLPYGICFIRILGGIAFRQELSYYNSSDRKRCCLHSNVTLLRMFVAEIGFQEVSKFNLSGLKFFKFWLLC